MIWIAGSSFDGANRTSGEACFNLSKKRWSALGGYYAAGLCRSTRFVDVESEFAQDAPAPTSPVGRVVAWGEDR